VTHRAAIASSGTFVAMRHPLSLRCAASSRGGGALHRLAHDGSVVVHRPELAAPIAKCEQVAGTGAIAATGGSRSAGSGAAGSQGRYAQYREVISADRGQVQDVPLWAKIARRSRIFPVMTFPVMT
jgi:hypothetical protein